MQNQEFGICSFVDIPKSSLEVIFGRKLVLEVDRLKGRLEREIEKQII